MRRTLTTALIAFGAFAGPAQADVYTVTGLGDAPSAPPCTLIQPTVHECSMLRSAVNEIGEAPAGQQVIDLPSGTITLTAGQLLLNKPVTISGDGARSSTVAVAEGLSSRAFQIVGARAQVRDVLQADGMAEKTDSTNWTRRMDSLLAS